MPNIYAIARQFRVALMRRDARAAARLIRAYGVTYKRIKRESDLLLAKMGDARARHEKIEPVWLLQQQRLQALQRQVLFEVNRFARFSEKVITKEQAIALRAGVSDTATILEAAISGTFNRLPVTAIEHLVGTLGNGSPLWSLLSQLGPAASRKVGDELVIGLALGQGPAAIARRIREALGGNLTRSLTIARTETLRAYRMAQVATYREQDGGEVEKWVWVAARTTRTCALCWAMDGSVHPVTEEFASHPSCRCTTAPWIPDNPFAPPIEAGEAVFARLDESQQLMVLGPQKLDLYRKGKLRLADLVGERVDQKWGLVRWEKSLKQILEARRLRRSA